MEAEKVTRDEDQFIERVKEKLEKYFIFTPQVFSKCRKGKIDFIIKLKTDDSICFGLECKSYQRKTGEQLGEYVAQSIKYSKYEFEISPGVFKRVPIVICPPISSVFFVFSYEQKKEIGEFGRTVVWHRDIHEWDRPHHTFNGFLGAFNVGEIRVGQTERRIFDGVHITKKKKLEKYLYISFSNKIIWSGEIRDDVDWDKRKKIGEHVIGTNEHNYDFLLSKISKI